MYQGSVDSISLFSRFKDADFISYSIKIKTFLTSISSVIYSSQNTIFDKFNMVDINEYFSEEEKSDFLTDLINAEYRCGYTGDIISDANIKKYRENIINSDDFEDKLKLADELLPTLKMKINLNKTSMFVIDFYLIEKGTNEEIKLPFHYSMRLAPNGTYSDSSAIKCKKFGEYDMSISKTNNIGNNYGIPHITFECNDGKKRAAYIYDNDIIFDNETNHILEGGVGSNSSIDKRETFKFANITNITSKQNTSKTSNAFKTSNISKIGQKQISKEKLMTSELYLLPSEKKLNDNLSQIPVEDTNICDSFSISSITKNNHMYLNVSKNINPRDYFSNIIELLENKTHISNITNLILIKKNNDKEYRISCMQKNNGDKKILETYIRIAMCAVVKLLKAFKKYYDVKILSILINPNSKNKLINYIKNVENKEKIDDDFHNFNNIARHYELYSLNNLLCSINAAKDYKRFLTLSIKNYNEYIMMYKSYKKKVFKLLDKKYIDKIINSLLLLQENYNDVIIKYNEYVINTLKSYFSYTHINIIGLLDNPNIEEHIVKPYDFNNMSNVNKFNFSDKRLENYYLVVPLNLKDVDNLENNLVSYINDNKMETYLLKLFNSTNYKNSENFNMNYLNNIIFDIFTDYFDNLIHIIIDKIDKIENIIDDQEYNNRIHYIKLKYNILKDIISQNSDLIKVYNNNKKDMVNKYKKIYKNDTIISTLLEIDIFKYLPPEPNTIKNIKYLRSIRTHSKIDSIRGGMPPKKSLKSQDNIKTVTVVTTDTAATNTKTDYKNMIIENLKILSEYEKLNKEPFKARAYNKVIDSIELTTLPITNIEDIQNINGVGDKISTKIKELIETGKMSAVENALKDPKYSLQIQLGKLYGVGPVKINELMKTITSFEELYERKDELLNDKQKLGLLYYNDMSLRIPMSEGKKHYKIIDKIFKETNNKIEFELVGSYRRQNKDMGDIDILIKNSSDLNLKKLVSNLISSGYIIETLANGKSKFMGLCKLSPTLPARRIDILISEPSYYYFALLYFTGSYTFNIYMRKIALEKGYSLSEYGLKDKAKKHIDTSELIKSEEDIFKFLDIPYVPPNKRNIV
jgi:DNA polymerase/3'-5' exonuclease PolX